MLSSLYSLLPFQALMSQLSSVPHPPRVPTASCYGNLLRPSYRLFFPENHPPQIYGYLPRARQDPNPGFLYLSNPSPAALLYIMGPDWRSHLVSPPEYTHDGNFIGPPPKQVTNYSYIPIPRDGDDEAQHCLRLKRCGGLWAYDVSEWAGRQHSAEWPLQASEKLIFGWPSDAAGGGVWVLRIPRGGLRRSDVDGMGDLSLEVALEAIEESDREGERMALLEMRVREQEDMDGVCDVLKDAGAVYYNDLVKCPEVLELRLLEPEKGRDDLIPPDGPEGGWKWRDGV